MNSKHASVENPERPRATSRTRGCLSLVGRGLMWVMIILIALVALGVGYQAVATEADRGAYAPRGQLYEVNGHQMHLVCMGEGSPTVVLEAGGAAESLWWYRVQQQLEEHTRVCAYDRPGHGRSEPTTEPRDALVVVGELHALLEAAGETPPYVMVGHSYGALWARIFAHQYPDEVDGVTLVDSTFLFPEEFASASEFDQWKTSNNAVQAIPWAIYRTGLMRLTAQGGFRAAGYPAEIIPELAALQSPNHVFDADFAEQIGARLPLTEATTAAKNLGDVPLLILWASQSVTAQDFFAERRAQLAASSSNSATRMVEGADHGSILGNEQYAQQVTDGILDVIQAAETGTLLAQ